MIMRRTLTIICALLLVGLVSLPQDADAQRLFVTGGALLSEDATPSNLAGTNPAISGG